MLRSISFGSHAQELIYCRNKCPDEKQKKTEKKKKHLASWSAHKLGLLWERGDDQHGSSLSVRHTVFFFFTA